VGNRLTQYQGAAKAFAALSDATANTLFTAFQAHPQYFTPRETRPETLKAFRDTYSIALRDFNTAGVVASHCGQRLSQLAGIHYDVYGTQVQLVKDRIGECLDAINNVVDLL
jgi:hypothetical protein